MFRVFSEGGQEPGQAELYGEDLLFAVANLGSEKVVVNVVGCSYRNPDGTDRQKIIRRLKSRMPVWLRREPENEWDPNAIAVLTHIGQIGYLERDVASALAKMLDRGGKIEAEIGSAVRHKGLKSWVASVAIWIGDGAPSSKAGVDAMVLSSIGAQGQPEKFSVLGWLLAQLARIFGRAPIVDRKFSKFEPVPKRLAALGPGVVQRIEVLGENGHNDDGSSRQVILQSVRKGHRATLVREPENLIVDNAIAVYIGGKQVGYVHKKPAKIMAAEMDEGTEFYAEVSEIRGGTPEKRSRGVWLFVHKME